MEGERSMRRKGGYSRSGRVGEVLILLVEAFKVSWGTFLVLEMISGSKGSIFERSRLGSLFLI